MCFTRLKQELVHYKKELVNYKQELAHYKQALNTTIDLSHRRTFS